MGYDGKTKKLEKPFFLVSGSYRDYMTIVKAANDINANIRIIGPKLQNQILYLIMSPIDTSSDPPDLAINYPTLKEWYAQCSGVCILFLEMQTIPVGTQIFLKVWR